MPQMMTALYGGSGPTWQVREVPVPRPGPGQVLVRAHAVSLNNADVAVLDSSATQTNGQGQEYLAGYEFAGDVAEAGGWCRHVGRGHEPQFGPWIDLPMWPNLQQPATRRFRDQSLPLPTTWLRTSTQ